MQTFDLVIILVFIIVVSFLVGLNIVAVIDKKLNNIEIKVPKPTVIVSPEETKKQEQENELDKKLDENDRSDNIENFNTDEVGTGGNLVRTYDVKEGKEVYKVIDHNDQTGANINNPNKVDVVNYGDYVCYKKPNSPPPEILVETEKPVTCKNESLNKKFSTGDERLPYFSVGCQKSQKDISSADYFKKKYDPPVAELENPYIKGANIANYVQYAGINDIGRIVLNQPQKFPKAENDFVAPTWLRPNA